MPAMKFKCPHCQYHVEVAPEQFGGVVACPSCKGTMTIPGPAPAPQQAPVVPPPAPAGPRLPQWGPPTRAPQAKQMAPGSVASFVWGLVGLFICGLILGVVAIRKSKQARDLIKAQPEVYSGQGLAVAGRVIGIIDVIVWLIAIVIRGISMASK